MNYGDIGGASRCIFIVKKHLFLHHGRRTAINLGSAIQKLRETTLKLVKQFLRWTIKGEKSPYTSFNRYLMSLRCCSSAFL